MAKEVSSVVEIWTDYTLRNVALGSLFLGIVSGVLGSFAVLRRQGLMGDALSHAALPGVCVAFLFTGSKAPPILMLGAALSGWIGMLAIVAVTRHSRLDVNTVLATVLTVFFGFGVVLLTVIQNQRDANQAGLDKFLFGQAAALTQEQVLSMALVGGASLLVVVVAFKEFKVVSFDPLFAQSLAIPVHAVGHVLTGLLVVAIVIGLNTVGVILMSAMLVAPAAAARQWTDSLWKMVVIAAVLGGGAGLFGALASVRETRTPTGPVIILLLGALVTISLLFAPQRGILARAIRHRRNRRNLFEEAATD